MVPATNRLIGLVTATGVVVLARAFALALDWGRVAICQAAVGIGFVVPAANRD